MTGVQEATILRAAIAKNGITGMSIVCADLSDGREAVQLFQYYSDELSFREDEFVGMTVAEARQLRHDRDVAYLRAP